jgi:thioredoxin-like negative regulator of GroEL
MEMASLNLESRRFAEALERARQAARLRPTDPAPRLCAAEALLKTGRTGEALRELEAAGAAGARLAALIKRQRQQLEAEDLTAAADSYRLAVEALRSGDFSAAAKAARQAVRAAPCEAAYRAAAVYAIAGTEGVPAARQSLSDYLEFFPRDPHIRPLARALEASVALRPGAPAKQARVSLLTGKVLPVGPAAGLITAMAARAGRAADPGRLAKRLAQRGANRRLRSALLPLKSMGISFAIGTGTLADLRAKLAAGKLVLVQTPPGELAGLRSSEHFDEGLPRLVVGYDDRIACLLVTDYGSDSPLPVPYALFDRRWSTLDRWWMVIPDAGGEEVPGLAGRLTNLELAAALFDGGDFRGARQAFRAEVKTSPRRARLGIAGALLALGQPEAAARQLELVPAGDPATSLQVELMRGSMELKSRGESLKVRAGRALPHFRKAWSLDPGSQQTTLRLCAALLVRNAEGDRREARRRIEDYLSLRPTCVPCLRLLYSR